jgi:hypothetical protein
MMSDEGSSQSSEILQGSIAGMETSVAAAVDDDDDDDDLIGVRCETSSERGWLYAA